jgi:hypothetical protein
MVQKGFRKGSEEVPRVQGSEGSRFRRFKVPGFKVQTFRTFKWFRAQHRTAPEPPEPYEP